MKNFVILLAFSLCTCIVSSQEKKSINIQRISKPPKIDGLLDDTAWQNAEVATDFVQFRPEMGITETPETRTVVKIAYDDDAIYVGAYLYDDPSKIMRQFTSRDNFGQSDFFAFILNPNNDGQNNTEFFVFSSGTQADALESDILTVCRSSSCPAPVKLNFTPELFPSNGLPVDFTNIGHALVEHVAVEKPAEHKGK